MPSGHTPSLIGNVKHRLLAAVLLFVALSALGCSSGRYTTMYLDRLVHERAEQEVKIETMSLDLEAAHNTITTLEMENQRLREASGELESKPLKRRRVSAEPEAVPAIDPETNPGAEKSESKPSDDLSSAPDSVPDLNIAEIEDDSLPPPKDADAAGDVTTDSAPDDGGAAFLPRNVGRVSEGASEEPPSTSASDEERTASTSNVSGVAVSLAFDKTKTRGEDLDGKPGDEGVLVVLQPRDRDGNYVTEVGPVVIEVVDSPSAKKSDSQAQVAEWKFSKEEVRRAMRNSALGRGAFLQVDWDEHIPANSKLLVIARWTTPKGEELTAQQVVKVNLSRGARAENTDLESTFAADQPEASLATRPSTSTSSSSTNRAWTPTRR